jgi:hypothetical protein
MRNLSFVSIVLILISLVSACSGQPAGAKTLEDYRMATDVAAAPQLTLTAEAGIAARTPPQDCPVTVPQNPPFTPPAPYSDLGVDGYFWYGSNSLWVEVPADGVWSDLPNNPEGYTQKIPWWREGYIWDKEPEPALVVMGERLDGEAPPLKVSGANGSYAADMGSAMMMGVDLPTLGCWKFTGKYHDDELSFVVWVAP